MECAADDTLSCPVCHRPHRRIAVEEPKTRSSAGRVDLDELTSAALLAWRFHLDEERARWGEGWSDHDLVFPAEGGEPMHPEVATRTFGALTAAAGLRHVRLHDLRHGQASLLLAAGTDIAIVSKRLRHSSVGITADTYSHLLDGVGRQAAEAAAALVRRRRPVLTSFSQPLDTPSPGDADEASMQVSSVGPVGLEPTTRGLKVRCSAS